MFNQKGASLALIGYYNIISFLSLASIRSGSVEIWENKSQLINFGD